MRHGSERIFLGWSTPIVVSAARWLRGEFATEAGSIDLTGALVVVPGRRFGRELLACLADPRASGDGAPGSRASVVAGQVYTPEEFLAAALPSESPAAGTLLRTCAWIAAEREERRGEPAGAGTVGDERADDGRRDRGGPAADGVKLGAEVSLDRRSLDRATMLDRASRRLSGEGLSFADVAERARTESMPAGRWESLSRVQDRYARLLVSGGYVDAGLATLSSLETWAVGSTRRESAGLIDTRRIVLVGVLEIPGAIRRVIEAWAGPVSSLVAAPKERSHLFDRWGAVQSRAWREEKIRVPEDRIRVVDGPAEQAEAAVLAMMDLGERDPRRVVIAAPDDEVRRHLANLSSQADEPGDESLPLAVRDAAGTSAMLTAPGRFLRMMHEFLDDRSFTNFAALFRHRDFERCVRRGAIDRPTADGEPGMGESQGALVTEELDLVALLDDYRATHVPGRVDGEWPGAGPFERAILRRLHAVVSDLFGSMLTDSSAGVASSVAAKDAEDGDVRAGAAVPLAPLSSWAGAIWGAVRRVFEASPPDRETERAIAMIERTLKEMSGCAALGASEPRATPTAAVGVVIAELSRRAIPAEKGPPAIETLGWLDAAYHPARSVILTGMNEKVVPRESGPDPMISESLSRVLGLCGRESSLARDMCLLRQLIASRDALAVICGRRSDDGTPRWPSRLLSADDDAVVVERLSRFTSGNRAKERETPEPVRRVRRRRLAGGVGTFEAMPMRSTPRVWEEISVTDFSRYLMSPYAFYLERALELEESGGESLELDARAFGDLIHAALQSFSSGDPRVAGSSDAEVIASGVIGALRTLAAERLGERLTVAAEIQIEQAALRLRSFARWQAERRAEGWETIATEWSPRTPVYLLEGAERIRLKGRIDRIDWNASTRELEVIDYKIVEEERQPEKDHRARARPVTAMDVGESSPESGEQPPSTPAKRWINLQLPLYRLLMSEIVEARGASAVHLSYVSIGGESDEDVNRMLKRASWTDDELADARRAAEDTVRRIRAGEFRDVGDSRRFGRAMGALAGATVMIRSAREGDGGTEAGASINERATRDAGGEDDA